MALRTARESESKAAPGVKLFGGEFGTNGEHHRTPKRGPSITPGENVGMGKDHRCSPSWMERWLFVKKTNGRSCISFR